MNKLLIANAIEQGLKYLAPDSTHRPGTDLFLCNAIWIAARNGDLSEDDASSGCAHIRLLIQDKGTFCTWLTAAHPELSRAVKNDKGDNDYIRLQITRRAWAEAMIEELRNNTQKVA
jgi:hypothetical protein